MPLTVLENIAATLYARLSSMIGNSVDFPTNVQEVIRPTRFANFTPRDRQIVLTEGVMSPVPELSCPGNPPADAIAQQFNIRCHLMPSERNQTAIDIALNQFIGDVRKCVCTPTSTWHNMGGFALLSQFENARPFTSDGGIEGINLPIVITYRVAENDHTVQR
jgi:hypothetical protein